MAGVNQTYTLDFAGVANSLQAVQLTADGEKYIQSESFSSISVPFCGGGGIGDGDVGYGGLDSGADLVLRPSKLLRGEVNKPWLKKKDWRAGASWWITVVSPSFPFQPSRFGSLSNVSCFATVG